jgi:hypothetical protein
VQAPSSVMITNPIERPQNEPMERTTAQHIGLMEVGERLSRWAVEGRSGWQMADGIPTTPASGLVSWSILCN